MKEASGVFVRDDFGQEYFGSEELGLEDFEEFGLQVVERKFASGNAIFAPGDPDDRLYFLISGVVRTYKLYDGCKEATTALVKSGGLFGNMDLVEGLRQDAFAEALTGSEVASVQKTAISRVMRRRPEFALKLFSSFFERIRESEEVIENLIPREVSMRLATLLLNLADKFGVIRNKGVTLEVRLTHQDLANMIASTREAVSKVMGEFQREGYIETSRREITLVDQAALAVHAYSPA